MQMIFRNHENATVKMNDQVHFPFNDAVNKQNYPYRSTENYQQIQAKPLYSDRVNIGGALAPVEVIGSYFC